MSRYFKDFPTITYRFGDNEAPVLFDNLTVYVDIIDRIVDNVSFYEYYNILDNERPDVVSYNLYGTVDYYWTFYLLNEHIRIYGWPQPYIDIDALAKQYYPNIVITTDKDTLHNEFLPGSYVKASNGAVGLIKKVIPEMGQLYIQPLNDISFFPKELGGTDWDVEDAYLFGLTNYATLYDLQNNILPSDNEAYFLTIENPPADVGGGADTWQIRGLLYDPSRGYTDPVQYEYLAAHHYQTVDGEEVKDIFLSEPQNGILYPNYAAGYVPGANDNAYTKQMLDVSLYNKITYIERLQRKNEELTRIKVLKPSAADRIVGEFRRLVRG